VGYKTDRKLRPERARVASYDSGYEFSLGHRLEVRELVKESRRRSRRPRPATSRVLTSGRGSFSSVLVIENSESLAHFGAPWFSAAVLDSFYFFSVPRNNRGPVSQVASGPIAQTGGPLH